MTEREVDELLEFLRRDRGFDFTGYKRPSLERRIRHRMGEVGIDSLDAYADFLEVHPDELAALFNTILINVTGFFRDPEAWAFVAEHVVPEILDAKGPGGQVRVWSAGCSSGEEAYTLAMVFDEAMGTEQFLRRVKVYGTDVDDDAIARARRGEYTTKELAGLEPERRSRYFEPLGTRRHVFRPDLRRRVVFGHHDLTGDTPISRVDLLVCRNTLIYLNTETQAEVMARFHFALNPAGFLFLGKSEALARHNDLFAPLNLAFRLFRRTERRGVLAPVPNPRGAPAAARIVRSDRPWLADERDEQFEIAQALVDRDQRLVAANGACRELFGLAAGDVGRPIADIRLFQDPIDLLDAIRRALEASQSSMVRNVDMPAAGADRFFDVRVDPLGGGDGDAGPVSVVFLDVTRTVRLETEARESKESLATAMEELQSANEELETTNEELQSTNEELETTNEELQSTNEELETMNEELQAATEQFDSMNRDIRERAVKVDEVNAFLESVLGSVLASVVVLDPRFVVVSWNHAAEQLWGLWSSEVVGHSFFGLDVGLPLEQLRAPLLACLEGGSEREELVVPATNRRGRDIRCRIAISPLCGPDGQATGLVLLMEEATGP